MNLSHLVWSAFVLSSVIVVEAQPPYIVNATIQKFRLDYRKFKSEWIKKADTSFFDVYNALNSTLGEIVAPFEDVKTNWTRMCRNFTEASLDNDTRLVFDTLCEKDVLLLEDLTLEREKWLTMLFYGDVTTDSPSVAILKKLFTQMELQMSEMWRIYASNSSCVETMIESYLPSYEPVIENVFFLNNETIANILETFKEAKVVGNDSLSIIGRFGFRVATECADAVVLDKCISFFYKKFQSCCHRTNCGPVYKEARKLQEEIDTATKKFLKFFESQQERALKFSSKVWENLWKWKIAAADCFI